MPKSPEKGTKTFSVDVFQRLLDEIALFSGKYPARTSCHNNKGGAQRVYYSCGAVKSLAAVFSSDDQTDTNTTVDVSSSFIDSYFQKPINFQRHLRKYAKEGSQKGLLPGLRDIVDELCGCETHAQKQGARRARKLHRCRFRRLLRP
jgi:hypothetical protein